MNIDKNMFVPTIEWEYLWNNDISFSEVHTEKDLYENIHPDQKVYIRRTNDYSLLCTLFGELDGRDEVTLKKESQAGDFLEKEVFYGIDKNGNKCTIKGAVVENKKYVGKRTQNGKPKKEAEISLRINELEIQFKTGNTDIVVDWYLSKKIDSLPSRTTSRVIYRDGSIGKNRKNSAIIDFNILSSDNSRDYYFIDLLDYEIVIQICYESFGPEWATKVGLEFKSKSSQIPSVEERVAIAEIIGFVLGTPLSKIGSTSFDENNSLTKITANNPKEPNIISICEDHAKPPIKSGSINEDGLLYENVLTQIIPSYLGARKGLNLDEVMHKYWIAKDIYIGVNLPILSSALENMASKYLKVNKLKRTYSKAEKSTYKGLVSPILEQIDLLLGSHPLKKKIYNSVQNPFYMGVGEKIKMFYEQLGFGFIANNNSIENQALRERNCMAHRSIGSKDEDIKRSVKLSAAYETLFNRTLLKVLGYDGRYVDYYTVGYPVRSIIEDIPL